MRYSYNRKRALKSLRQLARRESAVDAAELEQSERYIERAFDDYEGKSRPTPVDFVFAVPTRVSRRHPAYWSEVHALLPVLRHMPPRDALDLIACMPPAVIDGYGDKTSRVRGALVFVPIFIDMIEDVPALLLKPLVQKRINDVVRFAESALDARYLGLGATLPRLTNLGTRLDTEMIVTTGHAGTVCLLDQQIDAAIDVLGDFDPDEEPVGFIGCGAIGAAAVETYLRRGTERCAVLFDRRKKQSDRVAATLGQLGRHVTIASSVRELVARCRIVVSAVTGTVDVDGCSLEGRVIIDDSQPPSIRKEEVVSGGGDLRWVVGRDHSADRYAHRNSSYNFGREGLGDRGDVWGCEAEVATLARFRAPTGFRGEIGFDDVQHIGAMFEAGGIQVAQPQAFGANGSPRTCPDVPTAPHGPRPGALRAERRSTAA